MLYELTYMWNLEGREGGREEREGGRGNHRNKRVEKLLSGAEGREIGKGW